MLSRRGFVAALAAATAPRPGWAALGYPTALSAVRLPDGTYALTGLHKDGSLAFTVKLPRRGHAGAAHPELAEAVVIARRPGRFALVIDCATGTVTQSLAAPPGRHFYGHGAFSDDGTLLFTTENEIATGQGRIGVWDRRLGFQRIDEFPSGGIGPHELIRMPDDTLAIANGGIRTHPDSGREKLNLDTMQPNLTLIRQSGTVIDQVPANVAQNSLRHIAADANGRVVVGYQWQGDPFDAPPLIAAYADGALTDFEDDGLQSTRLAAYVGSVSAHGDGAAISSPRGGQVQVFGPAGNKRFAASATDICGLCPIDGAVLATDGTGGVYHLADDRLTHIARHNLAFDNHLVPL